MFSQSKSVLYRIQYQYLFLLLNSVAREQIQGHAGNWNLPCLAILDP